MPFAAPGDRLTVVREADYKRFARARIEAVLEPGPERTTPRCRRFAACGGCAWQHLDYGAQVAAKERQLAHMWGRGPQPDAPLGVMLPAPNPWYYRDRISLGFNRSAAGFFAAASRRLLPAPDCAIAAPALERRLANLTAELLRPLAAAGYDRLALRRSCEDTVDAYLWRQNGAARGRVAVDALAELGTALELQGVATADGTTWGTPGIAVDVGPVALHASPGVFTQVHSAMNRALVAALVAAVGDAGPVLDLYSGIGNFALPLAARGLSVHGVEAHRGAVADAKANAARLGLTDRAGFTVADLSDPAAVAAMLRQHPAACVILDPPRAGAAAVIPALVAAAPPQIIYVSCHPPAFLRDLVGLTAAGYRIEAATPFDMFPHTGHIELMTVLRRQG